MSFRLHKSPGVMTAHELKEMVGAIYLLGCLYRKSELEPLSLEGLRSYLRELYVEECPDAELARFHAVYLAAFE